MKAIASFITCLMNFNFPNHFVTWQHKLCYLMGLIERKKRVKNRWKCYRVYDMKLLACNLHTTSINSHFTWIVWSYILRPTCKGIRDSKNVKDKLTVFNYFSFTTSEIFLLLPHSLQTLGSNKYFQTTVSSVSMGSKTVERFNFFCNGFFTYKT